jgi:hypothetical protein
MNLERNPKHVLHAIALLGVGIFAIRSPLPLILEQDSLEIQRLKSQPFTFSREYV